MLFVLRLVALLLMVGLAGCSGSPTPAKAPVAKVKKKKKKKPTPVPTPDPAIESSSEGDGNVEVARVEAARTDSDEMPSETVAATTSAESPESEASVTTEPTEEMIARPGRIEVPTSEGLVMQHIRFTNDPVVYALYTPPNANVVRSDSMLVINAGPTFNMTIEIGEHDLKTAVDKQPQFVRDVKVVSETADTLILKKTISQFEDSESAEGAESPREQPIEKNISEGEKPAGTGKTVESYEILANRKVGDRTLKITSRQSVEKRKSLMDPVEGYTLRVYSLENCRFMQKAIDLLSLVK